MSLLKVDNITVKYNNIQALEKISLSIEEGKIISLIGANGAGKSTLLKSITALVPLASGQIFYQDKMIASSTKRSPRTDQLVARGISLVLEGRGVFPHLTVLENLEMGAFLVKDSKQLKSKLQEMYGFFPILADRRQQKAGSLSGGEQQMLAISRALMSSPRLLLLDEPGLGLAPLIIKDIFQIIRRVNTEEGVTIFLVEQNAKMALQVSDSCYVMETGKLVMQGSSKQLLEDSRVKASYLGE